MIKFIESIEKIGIVVDIGIEYIGYWIYMYLIYYPTMSVPLWVYHDKCTTTDVVSITYEWMFIWMSIHMNNCSYVLTRLYYYNNTTV